MASGRSGRTRQGKGVNAWKVDEGMKTCKIYKEGRERLKVKVKAVREEEGKRVHVSERDSEDSLRSRGVVSGR